MTCTGTQISYLHICHRKLWLFSHNVQMEQNSSLVAEGKLIEEMAYPQRAKKWQEIQIERIKIDRFDPQLKVIREIKKSNKKEDAHIAQLKYYLYVLRRNGIEVNYGVLEYPRLRIIEEIWLEENDMGQIEKWEDDVQKIMGSSIVPDLLNKPLCKKCAYYEFCYA